MNWGVLGTGGVHYILGGEFGVGVMRGTAFTRPWEESLRIHVKRVTQTGDIPGRTAAPEWIPAKHRVNKRPRGQDS